MMMPVLMIVVSVSWYYKNKKTGIIINIINYSVLILLKFMQIDKKRSWELMLYWFHNVYIHARIK
jgi:hypothetical protein